jgi:hypothetical protein
MFAEDVLGTGEVGDVAGDLQNPVIRSRAEVQFVHGHLEHAFGGGVEGAEALELLGGHSGVAADFGGFGKAGSLDFADALDALADLGGGFASGVAGEVLVFHGGDFDVDIDAVEERAGDAVAVALDVGGAAAAFAFRIAEEATFAWMRSLFAR